MAQNQANSLSQSGLARQADWRTAVTAQAASVRHQHLLE
jgi:hypothetical protein